MAARLVGRCGRRCDSGGSVFWRYDADACPPALVQRILTVQRAFAACMRGHGLPGFPDPALDAHGRPAFIISVSRDGVDPHASTYDRIDGQCQHIAPAPEARQVKPMTPAPRRST